eukprot:XP_024997169.1 syntaxin-4-like [Gallus gallus]
MGSLWALYGVSMGSLWGSIGPKRALFAPNPTEQKRALQAQQEELQQLTNSTRLLLQALEPRPEDVENLNSVSARVRRTQHGLLLQRFLEVTARLHAAQSHYRQRCLQRVRRHLHITGNSAVTDEELEEMLENGQSEVFVSNVLGAARATRAALDEVTSRHRELQRLERAMRELQELFAALGAAVEGQVGGGEEDDSPFCLKNTRVGVRLVAVETPECGHEGLRATATPKKAQLRCLYANARSMGNKQEGLEAIVQSESYDMVAITETGWDDSHSWSAVMDGY